MDIQANPVKLASTYEAKKSSKRQPYEPKNSYVPVLRDRKSFATSCQKFPCKVSKVKRMAALKSETSDTELRNGWVEFSISKKTPLTSLFSVDYEEPVEPVSRMEGEPIGESTDSGEGVSIQQSGSLELCRPELFRPQPKGEEVEFKSARKAMVFSVFAEDKVMTFPEDLRFLMHSKDLRDADVDTDESEVEREKGRCLKLFKKGLSNAKDKEKITAMLKRHEQKIQQDLLRKAKDCKRTPQQMNYIQSRLKESQEILKLHGAPMLAKRRPRKN